MRNLVVLAFIFLASCASVPPSSVTTVLRGVPGNATCASSEPYSGSFAVLHLSEPMSFGSMRNVSQVELLMDEPLFVQYGQFIGKSAVVSCRLSESSLCGYAQVWCGASSIKVEP